MLGAIVGDVVGSIFEHDNVKTTDFNLFSKDSKFTDDTVLTIAIADALLEIECIQNKGEWVESRECYKRKLKEYGLKYPAAGYGPAFNSWIKSKVSAPYNSFGNGSAMRVSAIGWFFDDEEKVLSEAEKSSIVSHNHPEGIKGAQAIALSVLFARRGYRKKDIKKEIIKRFNYNLDRKLDNIREDYKFDASCQGSVPEAIIAFLESVDFEDAIRKAVSLGGDSDTIACMTGAIAGAYYKDIPEFMIEETLSRLDEKLINIIYRIRFKDVIRYINFFEERKNFFDFSDIEGYLESEVNYSETFLEFIETVEESALLMDNYIEYISKNNLLHNVDEVIETADMQTLRALLTFYVLEEGKRDGIWAEAAKEGRFLRILNRIKEVVWAKEEVLVHI